MQSTYSRRRIITLGLGLGGASLLTTPSHASDNDVRQLALHSTHTRESISVTYFQHSGYDRNALQQLNTLLRDHRQNVATEMDPALFDQLWKIQQLLEDDSSIEIISGFRTQKTNDMLRGQDQRRCKEQLPPKRPGDRFQATGCSNQASA